MTSFYFHGFTPGFFFSKNFFKVFLMYVTVKGLGISLDERVQQIQGHDLSPAG